MCNIHQLKQCEHTIANDFRAAQLLATVSKELCLYLGVEAGRKSQLEALTCDWQLKVAEAKRSEKRAQDRAQAMIDLITGVLESSIKAVVTLDSLTSGTEAAKQRVKTNQAAKWWRDRLNEVWEGVKEDDASSVAALLKESTRPKPIHKRPRLSERKSLDATETEADGTPLAKFLRGNYSMASNKPSTPNESSLWAVEGDSDNEYRPSASNANPSSVGVKPRGLDMEYRSRASNNADPSSAGSEPRGPDMSDTARRRKAQLDRAASQTHHLGLVGYETDAEGSTSPSDQLTFDSSPPALSHIRPYCQPRSHGGDASRSRRQRTGSKRRIQDEDDDDFVPDGEQLTDDAQSDLELPSW